MNISKWILIATLFLISARSHAEDCMSNLPAATRTTVEQDKWTILQPVDLSTGDLQVWKNNHQGQCPGIAFGNFYPKADSSFLVALIQRDAQNNLSEKLLIITQKKDHSETALVVPPTPVTDPFVVWKLPAGHYAGIDGTRASISRESFVFEKINSSAKQFYYQGTTLKSFVISR
jgi:hypothetical protein